MCVCVLTRYPEARAIQRKVIFHAGPTNSGKTYHAIQRYLAAKSGVYCGPLKLLAHEIFEKSNEAVCVCLFSVFFVLHVLPLICSLSVFDFDLLCLYWYIIPCLCVCVFPGRAMWLGNGRGEDIRGLGGSSCWSCGLYHWNVQRQHTLLVNVTHTAHIKVWWSLIQFTDHLFPLCRWGGCNRWNSDDQRSCQRLGLDQSTAG